MRDKIVKDFKERLDIFAEKFGELHLRVLKIERELQEIKTQKD